jgi:hypothetical protein
VNQIIPPPQLIWKELRRISDKFIFNIKVMRITRKENELYYLQRKEQRSFLSVLRATFVYVAGKATRRMNVGKMIETKRRVPQVSNPNSHQSDLPVNNQNSTVLIVVKIIIPLNVVIRNKG